MRIGHGVDVHAFDGGPIREAQLRLGGVDIPFERALAGHSDADVVLHAVVDALLGAAALGDIGGMFPSSDERWRDADSRDFLLLAYRRVLDAGFSVSNLDVTIVAERPKLAPHTEAIRESLRRALSVDLGAVSVKAKTTDALGFTGRGEGIAAFAVVLLQ